MNKQLNLLTILVIFICIILIAFSKYLHHVEAKEAFNNYVNNLESNIRHEYEHRLEENIDAAIIFIESSEKSIYKLYRGIMNLELEKILQELNTLPTKKTSTYIKEYKNEFIKLSLKASNDSIRKSFEINAKTYYISVSDKKLKEKLISSLRDFLYRNSAIEHNYLWVNKILDFKGGDNYAISLIHPKSKAVEGMLLSTNRQDSKKNSPFIKELEGINKNKEIYFEYFLREINKNETVKLLVYSKLYEKKNWLISMGIPLSDLEKIIQEKSFESKIRYKENSNRILLIDIAIISLIIMMFFLLRNKVLNYFKLNQDLKQEVDEKLKMVLKEIEEKKILEKEKSYKQMLLESVINSSVDLIFYKDYKNSNGKYIGCNESFEKFVGKRKEEIIGHTDIELFGPKLGELFREKDLDVIAQKQDVSTDDWVTYPNNEKVFLHTRKSLLKDNDKNTIGILGLSRDMTIKYNYELSQKEKIELEKKKQEQIIQQQAKLATMGEMIANITHQWRQPLANLNGLYLNMELDFNSQNLNRKLFDDYLLKMEDITMYLSSTITDFSDFFKIDKEKVKFDIKEVLSKSHSMMYWSFKKSSINLSLNIKEGIIIESYPSELMQVVFTILNNAKDAFEGQLINNKYIIISLYKKDNYILLEFEDNAGGIKEEFINKIFDPYFTTKHKSKGTGLGLSIAKSVIEKSFQGKLNVENKNNGTLFTIKLHCEYL